MPVSRRLVALLAALVALLAAGPAAANTQTTTDPDDGVPESFAGKALDVRAVEISQGGGDTWVDVTIEHDANRSEQDAIWVAFDTNFNGVADYVARLRGFSDGDPSSILTLHPTANATATCQEIADFTHDATWTAPGPDGGGMQKLELHFPTAWIGGAASYRWAIYAQNDSLTRSSFDVVPDAANPSPSRPNPAPQNLDGCDDDGDGTYGNGSDRTTSGSHPAVPLAMAKGVAYPAEPATGGTGGEKPADPQPQPQPQPGPSYSPLLPAGLAEAIAAALAAEKTATLKNWVLSCTKEKSDGTCSSSSRFDRSDNDAGDVEHFFEKRIIPVKLVVRPVKLAEIASKRGKAAAAFMEDKGEGMDLVYQQPAPGTTIKSSILKPQRVVIEYWDPEEAAAIELKKRKGCRYDEGYKRKRVQDDRLRDHFHGTPPDIAQEMLIEADCPFRVEVKKAAGTDRAQVVDAHWDGKVVVLEVHRPVGTDLVLTVREDPAKVKDANDPGIGEDGAMPKGQYAYLTVQVTERATGRLVAGADVFWNGQRKRTDGNGEATFRSKAPDDGRFLLYASYGKDLTVEGFRELRVVSRAKKAFRTLSGRLITWSASKKDYTGTAADLARARKLGVVPALMGSGLTGPAIGIPTVQQSAVIGFVGTTPVTGQHNTVKVDNRNVLVAAAPGLILLAGGEVGQISTATTPYGQAGNYLGAVVGPLALAIQHKSGTVAQLLKPDAQAKIASTALQLKSDGVVLSLASLISDKGLGVIATGGGNVISTGGGNVISTGGGNVISTGGGNFGPQSLGSLIGPAGGNLALHEGRMTVENGSSILSRDGAGVIATGGGNVISTGGGNMSVYGGAPLIGQAGGN